MIETASLTPKTNQPFEKLRQRPYLIVTILFGVCLLTFVALLPIPRTTQNLFSSDGIEYFATLRSLVIDHDLNLDDEFHHLDKIPNSGSTALVHPVGMAIVWLPFYLVAHGLVWLAHAVGLPIAPDGYNQVYQFAVCLGSMLYGYVGLLLVLRLCLEFFRAKIALSALICLWFGWNVVYYLVIENSMSHMAALAAVSGLIAWWRFGPKERPITYWVGIGALGGLAGIIRTQDAAFIILPLLDLIGLSWRAIRQHHFVGGSKVVGYAALMLAGFAAGYSPQLAAAYRAYGQPWANGFSRGGITFNWTTPAVWDILFSGFGLFTRHPITLLAVIGLVFLARLERNYALKLALAVALQVYISAAYGDWSLGDTFGQRVLISCMPVLALGLTALFEYLSTRLGWWSIWLVGGAALGWNFLFMLQYRFGLIPTSESLSWKQLTWDKITMVADILQHGIKYHPAKN